MNPFLPRPTRASGSPRPCLVLWGSLLLHAWRSVPSMQAAWISPVDESGWDDLCFNASLRSHASIRLKPSTPTRFFICVKWASVGVFSWYPQASRRLFSLLRRFTRSLMYGICSSCLIMRARRSQIGLYWTGLPGPLVCRFRQRMCLIGVKSMFSNKSLGEPTSFILHQDDVGWLSQ